MENKRNFFLITGVSQTGGMGGGPQLGNFSHIIQFFSDNDPKVLIALVKIGDTGIRKVKTAPDGVGWLLRSATGAAS